MSAARFHENWRDLAHAVNREPEENWRAQSAHHGVRVAIVLLLALVLPLLFPGQQGPEQGQLEAGKVAPADVIASFDLPVPKPADQLTAERNAAERAVAPVFRFDPAAADSSTERVGSFIEQLGRALAASTDPQDSAVARVLRSYDVSLGSAQLDYLAQAQNRRDIRQALDRAFHELLPVGVASEQAVDDYDQDRVTLEGMPRESASRDSLTTVGEFAEDAFAYAPSSVQGFRAFQSLLLSFTVPSLRPDSVSWLAAREQARAQVDSTVGMILEGERIVTAHERVTDAQYRRLQAYNAELARRRGSLINRGGRLVGRAMFAALLLGLMGGTLFLFRPVAYREIRHFLIIIGLVAFSVAGAAVVERLGLPSALVPVVVAALAIGAVYDGMLGLVAVLASTLLVMGLAALAPLYDPVTLALGGAVAALGVRGVRRRRQSWALIAGITAAYLVGGLALTLLGGFSFGSLLGTVLWGFVGATLYTVLTLGGLVPLLEKITGISTAQTLLELSDLNAPLLRELSLKAPGTYAHSINIANLAEAACEAIGADSLLVRAGSYYHDIGKMVNPQYFVENQPKGRNPHDRLPALRSAAIIRDHVRDGVRLASENRLPPMIHDFIREHHGTGLIAYFYDKAVEEAGEEGAGDVNPGDFAYLGPKPQSRETAILMLADGIESATRVLGDPTPERIRATIEAIVEARFGEGQLDQCPLTLREIDRSKAAFARVLIGMYHRRIDYPSGVRAREEGDDAGPRGEALAPEPSRPRRRADRAGSEDQLEAALEAADAPDPEASLRAADE
ncbi:MAG: HDIG domain-containing protein [Gemmatimonadales bacterium]|jgi:hypothetical protein